MIVSDTGLRLIQEHEGLRLTAYPDPGTGGDPWTIGYGHTGSDVRPGLVITKERATQLLRSDVSRAETSVGYYIQASLNQNQFDALVSFTFNVGPGALKNSTLRKRLNNGEPVNTVICQEFPKWVKSGNNTLPGLVKRRQAEIAHATQNLPIMPSTGFINRAVVNDKRLKHQIDAWDALEAQLGEGILEAFMVAYRGPQQPVKGGTAQFPLKVPYFYQRDSRTGHGERMCYSSSMAMALEYINPAALAGDDDDYLRVVLKYGDTVSSEAQLKAAHSLGFDAKFCMDGTQQTLEKLLGAGVPVPIGILHKGPVTNPQGGGHWICLIGYDDTNFMVHDPFGELDLVNGGYPKSGSTDGKNQRYSKKNLMRRWLIASDHDGWYMDLTQS
jgi:GH24 family phage-related lysozyme (muramidase)